jgi:hypothetical protein
MMRIPSTETPHVSVDITNGFGDLESNNFAISHDALDSAHTDNETKGSLGMFHKSLAKAAWHGDLSTTRLDHLH